MLDDPDCVMMLTDARGMGQHRKGVKGRQVLTPLQRKNRLKAASAKGVEISDAYDTPTGGHWVAAAQVLPARDRLIECSICSRSDTRLC